MNVWKDFLWFNGRIWFIWALLIATVVATVIIESDPETLKKVLRVAEKICHTTLIDVDDDF